MLKVNEYFNGRVKSITFKDGEGPKTAGVMMRGEYEFDTNSTEYVTITSGRMNVLLPGTTEWKLYNKSETFVVPAHVKFKVKMEEETAYVCRYE
ncbi:MAG: pyrimidine/purine nucleoside phosphorylase [Bacteroidetes bacterium]|nr:pyrimidine/purine nucleoside phosphorylase [Bacteroidota bacterium]